MFFSDPAYQPRSARFLELWEWQGWRVKVNGLAAHADSPSVELVQAAKRIAEQRLPLPAVADDRYGAAYLVVHEGRDADFVLVDWWTSGGVVQHHVYGALKGPDGQLQYNWPPGAGFCVWELAVCWFERQAWVEAILSQPAHPDFEAYFQRRIHTYV
jgi:hypothetical protein